MARWGYILCLLPVLLLTAERTGAQEVGQSTVPFSAYPGAPAFSIAPSGKKLAFFPCAQCHQLIAMFPELAEQQASHVIEFDHGLGLMGCATCHDETEPVYLRTLLGEKVELDRTHLVCGSCHESRHRDWYFGAHGKRLNNWQGERVIYACSHCHDPHTPAIKPRKPMPPPRVRAGLGQPVSHPSTVKRLWERYVPAENTENRADEE